MFNFPSGKPKTHKPSNKYRYNRKTRQAIATQKAQVPETIETIYLRDLYINPTANLLDLSINKLEQLLNPWKDNIENWPISTQLTSVVTTNPSQKPTPQHPSNPGSLGN
jgi:hypothetical protein